MNDSPVKNSPSVEEAPLLIEILEMLNNESIELRMGLDTLESSLARLAPTSDSDTPDCRPYQEPITITDKIIEASRSITDARRRLRECNSRISRLF